MLTSTLQSKFDNVMSKSQNIRFRCKINQMWFYEYQHWILRRKSCRKRFLNISLIDLTRTSIFAWYARMCRVRVQTKCSNGCPRGFPWARMTKYNSLSAHSLGSCYFSSIFMIILFDNFTFHRFYIRFKKNRRWA